MKTELKRVFLAVLFTIISFCCFAQNSLKGTWTKKESAMGLTATEEMTFADAMSGKVVDKAVIVIDFGMFGIKVQGQYDGHIEGTFRYDGKTLTIDWDQSSFNMVNTKPMTVSSKKTDKGTKASVEKKIAELMEEAIEESKKEIASQVKDVYTSVEIKSDKLILKQVNEKGKTETEKYTRLK